MVVADLLMLTAMSVTKKMKKVNVWNLVESYNCVDEKDCNEEEKDAEMK